MQKTSMAKVDYEIAKGLAVSQLSLSNFRNYGSCRIDLKTSSSEPIVLFGQNGSGKTNLLEAVSFLASGRGLRGSKLLDVCKLGRNQPWAVAAKVSGKSGDVQIGTGLEPFEKEPSFDEPVRCRRLVRVDGNNLSGPSALFDHMSMIWLTPKMDRLFVEGASGRRKFFDQLVSGLDSGHAKQISSYEKSMRERIRVLTDHSLGGDATWIGALERKMAEHGVAIAASRIEVLAQLSLQIKESPETDFPKADIFLEGFLEKGLEENSALDVENDFRALLEKNRKQDAITGRTAIGPHKTDMIVCHKGKSMPAHLCSTGEQKALMIGIVLAHAKMIKSIQGIAPILLLDEVAAHLDQERRTLLFEEIMGLGSQAWLTGTDIGLFDYLKDKSEIFEVNQAELKRV